MTVITVLSLLTASLLSQEALEKQVCPSALCPTQEWNKQVLFKNTIKHSKTSKMTTQKMFKCVQLQLWLWTLSLLIIPALVVYLQLPTTFLEGRKRHVNAVLIFTSLAMPVELLAAWNGMSCMVSLYPWARSVCQDSLYLIWNTETHSLETAKNNNKQQTNPNCVLCDKAAIPRWSWKRWSWPAWSRASLSWWCSCAGRSPLSLCTNAATWRQRRWISSQIFSCFVLVRKQRAVFFTSFVICPLSLAWTISGESTTEVCLKLHGCCLYFFWSRRKTQRISTDRCVENKKKQ